MSRHTTPVRTSRTFHKETPERTSKARRRQRVRSACNTQHFPARVHAGAFESQEIISVTDFTQSASNIASEISFAPTLNLLHR